MNIFTLKIRKVSHDAITLGLHVMHRTQFSIVYSSVYVNVNQRHSTNFDRRVCVECCNWTSTSSSVVIWRRIWFDQDGMDDRSPSYYTVCLHRTQIRMNWQCSYITGNHLQKQHINAAICLVFGLTVGGAIDKLRGCFIVQEAQLMLTTGSTRLAVSRGQQTWYNSACYI